MQTEFPPRLEGKFYLTEGGPETEIMYKWGFELPEFALCSLGHLEDGDPVELGAQMGEVAQRLPRADILGGCCGTDERHLAQIAQNVNAVRNSSITEQ